jgi:hypothetical protein
MRPGALTIEARGANAKSMTPAAMKPLMTLLAVAGLAACSPSTVFVSSYRPPTAEPLNMRGERVAALVMLTDPDKRAHAEDALAREITKRGAQGLPMHRLLPEKVIADEVSARAAVEQSGVKGVVAMRPRRAQKTVVTPPSTYSMPIYSGFWGGYYGYYPYSYYGSTGWGSNTWSAADGPDRTTHGPQTVDPYANQTVYDPGHVDVYDVIRVEIVIYSLKQNQLVWAGESETVDPAGVDAFVEELVEGTAEELKRQWLIPG